MLNVQSTTNPAAVGGHASTSTMNSWEARALDYHVPDTTSHMSHVSQKRRAPWQAPQDAVIFPGLYSGSGFDIMSILLQVVSRPNPKIQLGPVDSSVAIILCDLAMPDSPIVYVTDSFCELTGYARKDVLGRNCRFLQTPPAGQDNRTLAAAATDKMTAYRLRQAVHAQEEIQLQVNNYRADGSPFTNALSIIPVQMGAGGYRYAVGFQVELE